MILMERIPLYLLNVILKLVRRINDIHPSSLGLHPLVYIYSSDGRFIFEVGLTFLAHFHS